MGHKNPLAPAPQLVVLRFLLFILVLIVIELLFRRNGA